MLARECSGYRGCALEGACIVGSGGRSRGATLPSILRQESPFLFLSHFPVGLLRLQITKRHRYNGSTAFLPLLLYRLSLLGLAGRSATPRAPTTRSLLYAVFSVKFTDFSFFSFL